MSADDVTAIRLAVLKRGYRDLLPLEGKRPPMKEWSKREATNIDEIMLWPKTYPLATNTGCLTRTMPTLDLDILNEDAARAAEDLVRERFEERGYVLPRIGKPPKRAILFRTLTPFPKITANFEGTAEKVELLCSGQQVVIAGIHPDTKKPYSWARGGPTEINYDELPYLADDEAKQLVIDVVALFAGQFGYASKGARPDGGTGELTGEKTRLDWGAGFARVYAGQELHDTITALAASFIAAGMSDAAAVEALRSLMTASQIEKDARWRARYDEIPRAVRSARGKFGGGEGPAEPLPLPYINISNWDNEPVPMQRWTVLNRVPRQHVALFSGEGGRGKSTEQLHLSAAHVLGREWLGSLPEQGPALFIDAEDGEDVIHRRLAAIIKHYDVRFADLIKGGLHLMSLFGRGDAVMATTSRSGRITPTPLYKQILEAAGDIKPVMIGIASSANVFAGSELDRSQVQQFIDLLSRLAILADGSVVLIAHPSLAGITNDSGLSGNTQWHNAVRARFYIKGVKPENGEETDSDLREIVFKKSNYGPPSESIVLRYCDGLFLPVPGISTIERAAREADADAIAFQQIRSDQMNLSNNPHAGNYAPRVFAKTLEAKQKGLTEHDFEGAMQRLIAGGKIKVERYGRPSEPRYRLVLIEEGQ
jgi:RecA-family ATPase